MGTARVVSGSGHWTVVRTRRWITAWLLAAALLAVLLLANSLRDYRRVYRILAIQQVRHEMVQYVSELEQRLRRLSIPPVSPAEVLSSEAGLTLEDALWLELRRPDGTVLASHGKVEKGTFTADEQSAHFRAHQPLFTTIRSPAGEVLVEVFPIHGTELGAPATPTVAPDAVPGGPPRSMLVVELAVPLAIHDPSVLRPIRQNLAITSAGALALLATVMVAGLAFRSYERRRWLEAQLGIAREVQTALLPSRTDDVDPLRLAATYRPAEQVSGDFYDAFRTPAGQVALVIGDVAGKGVPSALLAGVIHGAVRSATWTESRSQHERESERLNRLLCGDAAGGRYASMFWSYFEPATSTLYYVNAGHFPPLLLSHGNRTSGLTSLDTGGPVLGVLADTGYQQGRCEMRHGDTLVLYSDGLIEAARPDGEEYGVDRLRERLMASGRKGPQEIRDDILASVGEFVRVAALRDDLTLVVARLDPSREA